MRTNLRRRVCELLEPARPSDQAAQALDLFLILLIVYRSLLLPIAVLFTSVFALCAAILLVFGMAKLGWIQLNGQSQGILSILVIGAATDYALLYVARFREALGHSTNRTAASVLVW